MLDSFCLLSSGNGSGELCLPVLLSQQVSVGQTGKKKKPGGGKRFLIIMIIIMDGHASPFTHQVGLFNLHVKWTGLIID